MNCPILSVDQLYKSFSKVLVLDNLDFEIQRGEIHALLGENGAGKSTLIKIIAGVYSYNSGKIFIDGKLVSKLTPAIAQEKGIAVIYQEMSLVSSLTVLENVFLGQEKSNYGIIKSSDLKNRWETLISNFYLKIDPDRLVKDLSLSEMKAVEVLKGISRNAEIFIFDEPTDAMHEREVNAILNLLLTLKKQGKCIIFVSHRIGEVLRVCDRLSVLRDGKKVATLYKSEATSSKLIELMVGKSIENKKMEARSPVKAKMVFEAKNVSGGFIEDISFSVGVGEIVGFTGLLGAGKTELAEMLFGLRKAERGQSKLNEHDINNPVDAVKCGVGFVPENRKKHGCVSKFSVGKNISLVNLLKISGRFGLSEVKENRLANKIVEKVGIKCQSISAAASTLSGGNQQKVVLGKWLDCKLNLLILDEPTCGIDVVAKKEIIGLVQDFAKKGTAVLYFSSETDELLQICGRVLVMNQGRIVKQFCRNEANEQSILKAALGEL